jgi:hypothetical protein
MRRGTSRLRLLVVLAAIGIAVNGAALLAVAVLSPTRENVTYAVLTVWFDTGALFLLRRVLRRGRVPASAPIGGSAVVALLVLAVLASGLAALAAIAQIVWNR